MTIKKLKIPMYVPILFCGREPVKIAYGIERILAQANPTPTIEIISKLGSLKKKIDISPRPPATRAIRWVIFLFVYLKKENLGSW